MPRAPHQGHATVHPSLVVRDTDLAAAIYRGHLRLGRLKRLDGAYASRINLVVCPSFSCQLPMPQAPHQEGRLRHGRPRVVRDTEELATALDRDT